ncbi:uncharacterized protein HMPREF1541_02409 [Cyphellophora europaea CBS 101466]|uniref:ELYS-like domain-containing protein n=1 Tax=Cyphellophora europaea (strain CBS 101466) TaxID=1220924 RepID=W2S3S1_CYPE1|nr:uncharacterized protein HMPREF1541_02409 [Cyphellophora europaea CBS 101466]ETN43250.1 hypothetical protein HMPREF1541_02409 [Cyphellophora europaea CBS 101466]
MILGNCDPQGSVDNVKGILSEMESSLLPTSGLVDNAVLEVLAVHPDPLLRQSTIQKMRREWAPMSPLARQNNVAALIREGQLEAGQGELAQLESDSIEIPLWLRTVLCHAMCQEKEFELLLHIFYDYHDRHIELPRPTWLYILHETLAAGHLPTTDWIWQKHVEPMYIMPDADCCIRTLTLAIREQHLQLADNALEVLESIAPEQAKHCRDTVESAYSATGKVRAKTPRSRSLGARDAPTKKVPESGSPGA